MRGCKCSDSHVPFAVCVQGTKTHRMRLSFVLPRHMRASSHASVFFRHASAANERGVVTGLRVVSARGFLCDVRGNMRSLTHIHMTLSQSEALAMMLCNGFT